MSVSTGSPKHRADLNSGWVTKGLEMGSYLAIHQEVSGFLRGLSLHRGCRVWPHGFWEPAARLQRDQQDCGSSPCPPGLARPLPVSCRPPHLWRGRVNMSHAWKTKWNISEPAKGFNSRNEQRFGKSLIFFSKVYSSSIDTKISLSKNMNIWGIWQRADSGNLSLFIPCNYTCLYVCVLSVIDLNAVFGGILVID